MDGKLFTLVGIVGLLFTVAIVGCGSETASTSNTDESATEEMTTEESATEESAADDSSALRAQMVSPGSPTSDSPPNQGVPNQQVSIDWGDVEYYLTISNARFEKQKLREPTTGMIHEYDVLAFTAEAKLTFSAVVVFFAHFYDAEGIEVAPPTIVSFDPLYGTWEQGQRSRGIVLLPSNRMAQVTTIRMLQMM